MNPHYQRALMLFDQSRYDLAEQELRQSLSRDPDDAASHALLGICLAERRRYDEAVREVEAAVGLDPEFPFAFYARSVVSAELHHYPEAESAIREAIGLDPFNPTYFAQLAKVLFDQRRWSPAAEAAKQGLALDPEHVACTNLHAMALVKLGHRTEAGEAIATALQRDPEDTNTHANMGWTELENNRPQKAMVHFRESLRLDPTNEWARTGIIEAIKARNVIYRLLLGWFLWMMKLSGQARWGVILGAYAGYLVLRRIAAGNPTLAPWIMPILVAYIVFVVATWVASPLFNLVLRLDRFGRLALSREETVTSNWVGLCVLGALIALAAYFITGRTDYLMCAAASGLLIPPVAHIYSCHEGWPRVAVLVMTIGMAGLAAVVIGSLVIANFLSGAPSIVLHAIAASAFLPFIVAALAAQFGLNVLVNIRPRHGSLSARKAWIIGGGALAAGAMLFALWSGLLTLGWAAYAGADPPKLFNQPIRIEAARRSGLTWEHGAEVARETASLKELGFHVLQGIPDQQDAVSGTQVRLLFHSEESVIAELLENSTLGLMRGVSTAYDDGREITYYAGPEDPLKQAPGVSRRLVPGAAATELYSRLLEERPSGNLRPVVADEIIDRYEESYARDVDFVLKRGGPTAEEIREI
ncbi:MAG: tetratricopeptide repeat protein, partial [Planctomycetes bacterium]|nr:tetratricopeptide repeat protein [Planctomycetota bacterium]